MKSMIALENILIDQQAASWQEAIRIAAQPLMNAGSITQAYVEQMIQSVEKLGPYIVLMPGFALAHAAPGETVKKNDISLATFKAPVDFKSENGDVSVVMCLACTDKSSHVERLQSIAGILMEHEIIAKITACQNREAVYALFQG